RISGHSAPRRPAASAAGLLADLSETGVDAPAPAELGQSEGDEVVAQVDQVFIRYEPGNFAELLLDTLHRELTDPDGRPRRVLVLFPTTRWLQFFYVLLKHHAGFSALWALHSKLSDDKAPPPPLP
ncbi:unnamed protein product, partial [Prorocentrum cordatum]